MDEMNNFSENQNNEEIKEQGAPKSGKAKVNSFIVKNPMFKELIPKLTIFIGGVVLGVVATVITVTFILGGGNGNQSEGNNPDGDGHEHSYGEWGVVYDPTCTEAGSEERLCECGEKETRQIDALGHTEVVDGAVAPTCTSGGLTEGKHCSECNEVITTQVIIPNVPHTYGDWIIAEEPTCTTEGKKHQICSVCNHKVENVVPQQHTLFEHKCTLCDYEDEYIGKFDVSANNDGSIYAYVYEVQDEVYELCFYGKGEIKNFTASSAPYYPVNGKIKYVEFGDGITRIGDYTLFHWSGWTLSRVSLPDTLIEIGDFAFECVNFSNGLILPSSLITIGNYAFEKSAIGVLSIPDSVKYIGYQAFYGAKISAINLGSGIEIMEGNAFSDMHNNTIFSSLPKNEYKNGCYVASGDNPYYMLVGTTSKEITSLEIHQDTVVIYGEAFSECLFLKEVVIPSKVKFIDSFAFANCASLESITIPQSVTSICKSAFFNCNALTSIVFEDATGWWSMPLGEPERAISILTSVFADPESAATFFKDPYSRHLYQIK